MSYNTKLVDVKDFKSYWDLLSPKWKGKIHPRMFASPAPARVTPFVLLSWPISVQRYQQIIGEMDVTCFAIFAKEATGWRGKVWICFFCEADISKQQGLPVDTFGPKVFKEGGGLVQQFGTWLVNRAPHPNAAKVFINWLLSRKGQIALQKLMINTENPRIPCVSIFLKTMCRSEPAPGWHEIPRHRQPEWKEMKPIIDVVNEALKAAGKKMDNPTKIENRGWRVEDSDFRIGAKSERLWRKNEQKLPSGDWGFLFNDCGSRPRATAEKLPGPGILLAGDPMCGSIFPEAFDGVCEILGT